METDFITCRRSLCPIVEFHHSFDRLHKRLFSTAYNDIYRFNEILYESSTLIFGNRKRLVRRIPGRLAVCAQPPEKFLSSTFGTVTKDIETQGTSIREAVGEVPAELGGSVSSIVLWSCGVLIAGARFKPRNKRPVRSLLWLSRRWERALTPASMFKHAFKSNSQ